MRIWFYWLNDSDFQVWVKNASSQTVLNGNTYGAMSPPFPPVWFDYEEFAFSSSAFIYVVLIDDKAAVEKLQRQTTPRQSQYVRSGAMHIELSLRNMRKIGAQGGKNSRKNLGKRLVKQLARRAAKARWKVE
jgi:hypothetical protein